MATPSKKNAAESAARELLEDKVSLVSALAQATDAVAQAENDIVAARERKVENLEKVRLAYDEARAGGWTAAQLSELGYERPRARKTKRSDLG